MRSCMILSRLACLAVLLAANGPAGAQSLAGFRIGDLFADDADHQGEPDAIGDPDRYVPRRWTLPDGTSLSVTTDTASGRIVFVEQDGVAGRTVPSAIPGLVLGETPLSMIRTRFGSDGFGFASTAAFPQDGELASATCYPVRGTDAVLATITARPMPPHPDSTPATTGTGTLRAVILSDRAYLDRLWGPDEQRDPTTTPIALP